ncbi:xylosidase/arabinofuranosidase [Blautia producta]|uniref:xylosidase/arabinofuranosidase n=1 Tax=Blautia producta TaxID=33035 RepID=UPI0035BE65CC
MKGFKRGIAAATTAALCLTSIPMNGLCLVSAAEPDRTVKLQPGLASTFHDTNEDGLGEFEGWGTSLCWWANRIGYSDAMTEKAAEVFFSDKGLDMNIGRYNVGGGDHVGVPTEVPVNEKALFYDLETEGYKPQYSGSKMAVSENSAMKDLQYTVSDADFGITKGNKVGIFKSIGWINKLGDTPGDGDNLRYTVNAKEEGKYTVKLLLTLTGSNKRDVAVRVNDSEDHIVDADTINKNLIASGNNNLLFLVTIPDVNLNAGENTLNIAGKNDWTLDFVKMAVIKSGEEGTLPEGEEYLHSPHITRSDSAVPGYAVDVTKIDTSKHELSWYEDNFDRADEECGYAWNYNWDADVNQLNILKAAAEASGEDFIAEAFSNSPPYFMTNSGCSSGAVDANKDNLRSDSYHAFAAYMADVIEHWNDEDVITFQSTTPMNEPYTSYWGAYSNKQEGCHFDQGESQSKIIEALNEELKKREIDIIISGTDETSIDTAITSYNALSDEAKNIIQRIDTHTYGGSKRSELKALAEDQEKNLWMSEVDGAYTAGTNAGEMSAALGMAKAMMQDVNGLNASAWILWNAIDMHVDKEITTSSDADYASLDELYRRVDMNSGYWGIAIGDHDNEDILLTKKYYAYGQLSRYIRPGYTIIGSSDDTLAAYDPEGGKVVVAAVNTSGEDKTWKFDLSSFSTMGDNVTAIRTSGSLKDGENWADVSSDGDIIADTAKKSITATLKANSITTYIVDGVTYDSTAEEITKIEDVNVYTIEDIPAVLPETVQTVTNKNNTMEKKVTWNLEGVDLTQSGDVTGSVEGTTLTATAKIQVVAPNMIYFIDCNSPESPKYAAMDQYADLLNEKADQAYTEGSWGYLDAYGKYNGDVKDEYDTGWYANSGQTIKYTVPLDAGKYNVTFGFKEWWRDSNKSRKMTISATQESGTKELGSSNTWNGGNWWNSDTFELVCEETGDVTFSIEKQSGQPDPVLSFIQIQKVLDLDELKAALKAASEVERGLYPAAKLAVLDAAVEAGKALALKASTTQEELTDGAKAITDAIEALGTGYTEEEIAANDHVLYLVNCGTPDASVVPENYIRGLYQSNVDQEYAADADTGLSWGYEPNDENSKIVNGGKNATDITESYIYMADTGITFVKDVSGFKYKFELPDRANSDYAVTLGFKNPWDTRNVDIKLEGETVESDLNLTKSQLIEKTYKTEVTDGELNVMVHSPKRTNQYGDPVLSYIIVKAVAAYTTDRITEVIASYQSAMEGHSYSESTKGAFDEAVQEAQALVDNGSTDQKAIKNALNKLEETYNALKEIYTYSSITGTNGAQLFDNNGNKIQAHGGQIQQFTIDGETKYYWYGEDKTNGYRPVVGVHLYTSSDLYNWTDEGVVLRSIPVSEEDYGKDQTDGYKADLTIFETDEYFKNLYGEYADQDPDDTDNYSSKLEEVYWNLAEDRTVIERPKVLYNDATGKYVMWFHADGRTPTSSADYGKARAGIAISDSPTGPFKLLGTYKLHDSKDANHSWDNVGGAVRDMNLFKDEDGQGYVIYSSDGNLTTYIAKLNDSYTGLIADPKEAVEGTGKDAEELRASNYTRNFIDASREAPAMFKYKGKYYIVNSGCTGWAPNKAQYAVADHPLGPWTVMGDPCVGDTKGTTFDTQSTCVFPVDAEKGKFIYMGDRWYNPDTGGDLSDSRYVWLPVEFLPGDQIQLKDYADWTLEELENKASFEIVSGLPTVVSSVSEIQDVLPSTVVVDFGSTTAEMDVTWDVGTLAEDKLGIAAVTGILTDGNRKFTHNISIVNPKLIYFFDSGADTSEYYDTVNANLLGRLRNGAPDGAYTEENGAGYTGVTQSQDKDNYDLGHRSGDNYLSNGWWAASGKNIEYAFDLEPGTYTVSAGFQEWWNTSRPSKMTIKSGDKTLKEKAFTVYNTSTDLQVNQTFEVTEENAGRITVTISKTGNPDPVLSWIAVTHDDASVNKDKLETLITAAGALKKENYSEATWAVLSSALDEAIKAAENEEDQRAVDEVVRALLAAMEGLESTADKDELQKLVDEVNEFDHSIYTAASWSEYEAVVGQAKTDAQRVLDDHTAIKEDVDAAIKALHTAFEDGKEKLVTIQSVLESGIAENRISESSKDSYTEESWADYQTALEAAEKLMGSNDEAAVNAAIEILAEARKALVQKPGHVVDKTELIEAIAEAPAEEEAGLYTAASWTPYAAALTEALNVRDNEQAGQLDVDSALAVLIQAQEKLVTLEDKLAGIIKKYSAGISSEETYTAESWSAYAKALAAAAELQGKDGLTEEEIDTAEAILAEAYRGLVPAEIITVHKEALKAVIEQTEQLKKEDYTEEAWTVFTEALSKAQGVYDNEESSQEEVNTAVSALTDAIAELKKHPAVTEEKTDKSALRALLEQASQLKKDDYTGTTWEKFQKAFDDASNINESDKATQEQIDTATAALKAAMDQLEKVAAGPNEKPKAPSDNKNNGTGGKKTNTPTSGGSQKGTSSAKTGDETPIGMFAGFGAVALIAIFACTLSILRKRKKYN